MLQQYNDGTRGESKMLSSERWMPDYESTINSLNNCLKKETGLRDALFAYLDGKKVYDKLAELLGEIVMACRNTEANLDRTIKLQEEAEGTTVV